MKRTYKHEVINSCLNGEEIKRLIRNDFSWSFKRRYDKNVREAFKAIRYNRNAALGEFSMIGKSGQKYNFHLYRMFDKNGQEEFLYGVVVYVVSHDKFGISYFTIATECGADIFDFKDDEVQINRYTEHAISRCMERNGKSIYGKNAFVQFFREVSVVDTVAVQDDEIIAVTFNGALVGRRRNGINYFNTYYNEYMVQNTSRFRKCVETSNLYNDYLFVRTMNTVRSLCNNFEDGFISVNTFLTRMTELRNDITDEYLEYAGTTRQQFDENVKRLIEKNAIRSARTDRDALLPGRQTDLRVSSCIPRIQEGVQAHQRLLRGRVSNYFS